MPSSYVCLLLQVQVLGSSLELVGGRGVWEGEGCGRERGVGGRGVWEGEGCGRERGVGGRGVWEGEGCGRERGVGGAPDQQT